MKSELLNEAIIDREAHQARANREELAERIAQLVREDGVIEPMEGLFLYRGSAPSTPSHAVAEPAFCVIAQGSKQIVLGDELFRYDPAHYLLTTVELPLVGQVIQASNEQPYLSLRLRLDPALVSSVVFEAGQASAAGNAITRALDVSPLDAGLLDATVRLIRLLSSPPEARILAPLVTREIVFRLLIGEQGGRLRHLVAQGGHANRIARAVSRIRRHFHQPLRIDDLARELGMSVSGFHHQFKAVTTMTPLQFQKQLRLQEARRLIIGGDYDAASAGYQVGYEDASHFSREYKRQFGQPPIRDAERLRAAVRSEA